jgi:hypothetical protein
MTCAKAVRVSRCPHPNCDTYKALDEFACKKHWRTLPRDIRNKIWNGWKTSAKLWNEADTEARKYWSEHRC